ncbi:MAG: hypothetical protein Q8S33_26320 [Myxococcales bacterium]|nr:hypothetical protein [Myxococcales bacterium]
MMLSFVCLLMSQAPSAPPVVSAGDPATTLVNSSEAMKPPADEPAEVKAFAQFVDRHLLTLDPDMSQGALRLRQREHTFSLKDDDFPDAFKLVPEAYGLAQKAQENFRTSSTLQIVGLAALGGGTALVLLAPLLASGAFLPLLIAGLVLDLVAMTLVLVALPFSISASTQFTSAVATYNRGLLDLRPMPDAPGRVNAGGLTIPLP